MTSFQRTFTTHWSPERAFAYMADFSHAQEWDPSVLEARRVDTGTLGVGSAFDLKVRVAGRVQPMRYVITQLSPRRVTFMCRLHNLQSVDTITVDGNGDHTEVHYEARLHFDGVRRVTEPIVSIGFRLLTERAARKLAQRLVGVPPHAAPVSVRPAS
jgi:hypothetical protein